MGGSERRTYDSSGRRAEAAARRARTLETARRLFAERGYGRTTIAEIAEEAGVSAELVYSSYGSKKDLLLRLHESFLAGDTDETPLIQREAARALQEEPSPERACELGARLARDVYERSAEVWRLIDHAATVDPEIESLRREREQQRFQDVETLVESVARLGPLRSDTATAIDITYALASPAVYLLLVEDRNWSPDAYEAWLATALKDNLLPTPTP